MITCWLLLACRDAPTADPPTDDAPPTPVDTGTTLAPTPVDTGTPTSPPAPPPNVAVALGDCGGTFRTPDAWPNQLVAGDDLRKFTLTDPLARCNDGTPGVLYLRSALDPAHADDWVLHLQGGSDCLTYADCAIRWCGTGYYDASKMSSTWTPPATQGLGIHSPSPENLFAGWNHAFFYYCTSDMWQGDALGILTDTDGVTTYSIERRGHAVLAAGIAALEAGATSDDGTAVLPPIGQARTVLFTGTSAGSIGAQTHLDWLADRWGPGIALLGVFDAAVSPAPASVPGPSGPVVEAESVDRYAHRVAEMQGIPPFGDASCLATVAPADAWHCGGSAHLPYAHISGRFLARMDHFDGPTGDIYVAAGATVLEFAEAVTGANDLLAARGAATFGPACGDHLGLEVSTVFQGVSIDTPTGPLTLEGAIAQLVDGETPTANDRAYDASSCLP